MCYLWSLSVRMTDTGSRQVKLPANGAARGFRWTETHFRQQK